MSFLLAADTYASVQSLFESMTYHLAVQTVLAGSLPGRIYVDNPVNPIAAILIPSNPHRVYVSGSPEPDLLGDVISALFKQSLTEGDGFLVYDASNTWKQTLAQVLPTYEIRSSWRQLYRLKARPSSWSKHLPEHIIIGRIDEMMLVDPPYVNSHLLHEEILSESPSLEHFFRHNFGFAAHDGDTLVAWCLAEYHDQGRYELGIETIEAYRRQGIATHLAAAVIEHAFTEGATEIGWHCWATNTPSIATALKLGFEKRFDYPVYFCQEKRLLT